MPFNFRFCIFWLLALLVACTNLDPPEGSQRTPPLRVGISGDYPPFCLADTVPGIWLDYHGFDLDLLKQLTHDLKLAPIQTVPFQWPNLAKTLAGNHVDLAVCGITARPDRARSMIFTRPYLISGAVAALRGWNSGRFKGINDLDRPGVRLGVNAGGHLERVARNRFRRATIKTTRNNLELQTLLSTGAVDAVVSDTIETASWSNVKLLGPFTHDQKSMALPLDHAVLRNRINDWLAAREADGWLSEKRKALGKEATISQEQVCAEAITANLNQRFSLMPLVGAVKRREGLPISDLEQEVKVLNQAREMAAREDFLERDVVALFKVVMDLSKAIQQQNTNMDAEDGLSLPELRRAVEGASSSLLPEIRRCQPTLVNHPDILQAALRQTLGKWLTSGQIETLWRVLPPRAFSLSKSQKKRSVAM